MAIAVSGTWTCGDGAVLNVAKSISGGSAVTSIAKGAVVKFTGTGAVIRGRASAPTIYPVSGEIEQSIDFYSCEHAGASTEALDTDAFEAAGFTVT